MPFFKTQQQNAKVTETDKANARRLSTAIRSRALVKRPFSIKSWSECFAKLRTIDGINEARIAKVLLWYCANMRKKYVPLALSAKGFRDKFLNIEEAMVRDIGIELELTPEGRKVVERLSTKHWPKDSAALLPAAVQTSLNNYREFLSLRLRLTVAISMNLVQFDFTRNKTKVIKFSEHLRSAVPAPSSFVEAWFLTINRRVQNWDDWSGDLQSMAFTIDSKGFRQMGKEWAVEYCSDPKRWDMFIDALKQVQEKS